jgi:hypothetical protein
MLWGENVPFIVHFLSFIGAGFGSLNIRVEFRLVQITWLNIKEIYKKELQLHEI